MTTNELPVATPDLQEHDGDELKTIPEKYRFIDQIHQFLLLAQWTSERLAKEAGISRATMSQFMNNKYGGNIQNIRRKISDVIERENEKLSLRSTNPDYVDTTASTRMFEVAKICHLYKDIGVCYADAGIGKTEAVREYSRMKSDVLLIEADPGYTPTVLFRELSDKLGIVGRHNLHLTFVSCVARLHQTGRLLIIDEAEQLPYKSLEMVRRLHDKSGIGILLTGMPKLIANLRGYKGEYSQLYSRVGIVAKLEPLTENDVENIIKRKVGDTNGLWRVFYKESKGNTRRLFKIMRQAFRISDLNSCAIDTEVVVEASNMVAVERRY